MTEEEDRALAWQLQQKARLRFINAREKALQGNAERKFALLVKTAPLVGWIQTWQADSDPDTDD